MNAFEIGILDGIQTVFGCPLLDKLMPLITLFGEGGVVCIATALVMILQRKTRKTGLAMGLALLIGVTVGNLVLKNIFARIRPCDLNPSAVLLVERLTDYSFPSGHSLALFECATVLWIRDKRIGIPAVVVASLVGFSRTYLYLHYPTDVLGGAALGILFGIAAYLIIDRIYRRYGEKIDSI